MTHKFYPGQQDYIAKLNEMDDAFQAAMVVMSPSDNAPLQLGEAASGVGIPYARWDHVHPSVGVTVGVGNATTDLATTEHLQNALGDVLLKSFDGVTNIVLTAEESRHLTIRLTGVLTGPSTLEVPAVSRLWLIENNTSGNFTITVKTAAGAGVEVAQGLSRSVYCDGANVKVRERDMSGVDLSTMVGLTAGQVTGALGFNPLSTGGGTVDGDLVITGTLTLNNPSTIVNSTSVTVDDVVLTLGGDTAPTVNDGKDRGIEFRWHDGVSAKAGFFGFDRSTGRMVFIPDAVNAAEVFSGDVGTLQANLLGNVTGSLAGNASTATALETPRTINGVSFDGSANISFGTGAVEEGSNLYYTDARARSAISVEGLGARYDNMTGVITVTGAVSSVAGRTGDILLSHSDIDGLAAIANSGQYADLLGVPTTFAPPMASATVLGGVKVGNNLTIDADGRLNGVNSYVLPAATTTTLGGVKVGAGFTIDVNGVLTNNMGPGTITPHYFTATDGQTEFVVPGGFTASLIKVYSDGRLLPRTDYNANDGLKVVLGVPCYSGEEITVEVYSAQSLAANSVITRIPFTATDNQTVFPVTYPVGAIFVKVRGDLIDTDEYTANNGTSVVFNTGLPTGTKGEFIVFSQMQIADAVPKTGGQMTGNLTLSGDRRRILIDAPSATSGDRFGFQSSTPDSATIVSLFPSGTGSASYMGLFSKSDAVNAQYGYMGVDALSMNIAADRTGTGAYVPMRFMTGGAEQMRVTTGGNLGVGTTAPTMNGNGKVVHIHSATAGYWSMFHTTTAETGEGPADGTIFGNIGVDTVLWNYELGAMIFATNSVERGRFDSGGRFLVGKTSATYTVDGVILADDTSQYGSWFTAADGAIRSTVAVNAYQLLFYRKDTGGFMGSITNGAANTVSYNTSSDYRLKEEVKPIEGALASIMRLRPVTYKWKGEDEYGEGFIAHELQEEAPGAVTGRRDEVDEKGDPKYQGVDPSKLVGRLTAALQELKREFDVYRLAHP